MDDKLKKLREQIDAIDDDIVSLVSKRMDVVKRIGELKKEHHVDPLDMARLEELLQTKKERAKILGVSEVLIEKLFNLIHEHSVKTQKKL